jgi:hypothetical protein
MTNSSDRLDRVEVLLAQMAEQQAAFRTDLTETKAIVDSNARAIEANSNGLAELRQRTQETLSGIDDAVEMITSEAQRNAQEHEDFRSFIRGLQTEIRRIWGRTTDNGEE